MSENMLLNKKTVNWQNYVTGVFIRLKAIKYRHGFLSTIIKEIQSGPFTESTA